MPDSLQHELQSALGATYVIESELGGGGMSRVFVARDTALSRAVVVKVLSPDLVEGLSAERFAREIQLAAGLQEPHIVPLLAAGATGSGLPYYTMPFVEGESLRARLERAPMSLGESVDVLRDVARALAYAHERGIVHRDIKPDNVLLSSGTAVVTDFGIAKALQLSKSSAPGSTLTQVGSSIGTPGYMAPEQAAGDDVDHRADIYAWGVMAYELLAGAHPFAGKTSAQQLMAAHIAETPLPLAARVPNAPALASLVMRCLAKDPAARPASARAVLEALPAVSGSGDVATPPARYRRRRWPWVVAAIPAVLIVAALVGWFGMLSPVERATFRLLAERDPVGLRVNRVVVSAFRNETGDPSLAGIGPLAADVLTSALATLPSLEVVDARTAAATSDVVRRMPRFFRRADAGLALADEVGAKVLVDGSYYREGDSVRVRARVLDAATGAVRQALPEITIAPRTPGAGLRTLAERAVVLLRAASDQETAQQLGNISIPASLAAQDELTAAYKVFLRRDTSVVAHANRAIALDTAWTAAYASRAYFAGHAMRFVRPGAADSALEAAQRRYNRMEPLSRALVDVTTAKAAADARAELAAAQHRYALGPNAAESHYLVANASLLNRRPHLILSVIGTLDPNRGISIPLAASHWYLLSVAYAQLEDWPAARSAALEGLRRAPLDTILCTMDMLVAGARGDVPTLQAARTRAQDALKGELTALTSRALALLATRGAHPDDARALARRWLSAAAPTANPTSPAGDIALHTIAEDWTGALPLTEPAVWYTAFPHPTWLDSLDQEGSRALVLAHLGRLREARAADARIALMEGRSWNIGAPTLWRARIAAHLGEQARAAELAEQAVHRGALWRVGGLFTIDSDPFLVPLRDDRRFRALAQPSPEDGH